MCFVFSGSNVDQKVQRHCPLAFGWCNVSKLSKISVIWFVENIKKKRFEKRPNVCKWLKVCFKYCIGIQLVGNGVDADVSVDVQRVGHVKQVQHVDDFHLDARADKDHNINYYNKSGEIKPFRAITNRIISGSSMLISQLIFFYQLDGLFCLACLVHLVRLVHFVCLSCLVRLFCLFRLVCLTGLSRLNILFSQLILCLNRYQNLFFCLCQNILLFHSRVISLNPVSKCNLDTQERN